LFINKNSYIWLQLLSVRGTENRARVRAGTSTLVAFSLALALSLTLLLGTSQTRTNSKDEMYCNLQGDGCNLFFKENEFFGRVATRDFLFGGTN
jgi:hypothetical protein